jgi:hypothetical protein
MEGSARNSEEITVLVWNTRECVLSEQRIGGQGRRGGKKLKRRRNGYSQVGLA